MFLFEKKKPDNYPKRRQRNVFFFQKICCRKTNFAFTNDYFNLENIMVCKISKICLAATDFLKRF